MEVHAHAHPSTSSGHRKKWTHYLWEFLMLFLAVFCGFLAENQREHMIEHNREKQYMQSLVRDLVADTIHYRHGIGLKEERIRAVDTVFIFFNTNKAIKSISGKFFKSLYRTNWDLGYTRNTITINQLKNTGGMRLIRNKMIANSITSYDFLCEHYASGFGENYKTRQEAVYNYLDKLTNASDLLSLYISNNNVGIVNNIPDTLNIRINTTELNQLLNFLMRVKTSARQEINQFMILSKKANNLIGNIKKEYHLE